MFLTEAIKRETVCYLTLPTSHQIASLYNPVYTLNAEQRALLIRGDYYYPAYCLKVIPVAEGFHLSPR